MAKAVTQKITKKTNLPLYGDRECVNALKALGEDNRMRIIRLLMDAPLGVCEIARRLDMEYYNVSRHLRVLRDAGLLEVEKRGREHVYVVPERILRSRAHARVLDLGCCSFHFDQPTSRSRG